MRQNKNYHLGPDAMSLLKSSYITHFIGLMDIINSNTGIKNAFGGFDPKH